MTTLKSSVRIAGQVISNNDPQMVITLDAHPSVQIASIQDDSITYEFKGGVTQEALYNLNLTFTYQGRYEVKVPCTFKHTVVQVDYEVRPADLHVKAWENGNALPFQVWHDGVDVTSQLTDVTRGAVPEILDYSYAPGTPVAMNKYWWLAQVAVGPEKTVTVDYTFKLPASIDPAQMVRNASGNFIIAPYDGTQIKAEYKDPTPFLVAKGTKKSIFIDIFYKGYYNPVKNVSFLKAHSTIYPFTSGGTGGTLLNRFEIELTAPDQVSEQDLRISLGTSTTDLIVGKNISTVNVPSRIYAPGITITTTPLTLKLWETKPLAFTITNNGADISGPISNITMTDTPEVSSKYELVKLSDDSWGIKAISSSTTAQLTASATLNFTFMDGGTEHVMSQTVSLTTEINNGEIPTNRFNVEFL